MRIRKRFPPSSPLSDPQLNRSPVVQQTSLQLHPNGNIRVQEAKNDSQPSDPLNQPPLRPLPSDQQTIIAAERSKRILISDHELKIKQKQGEKERCTEKQDQENDSNNPRKESILLGVPIAHTGSLPPVSTSHQVAERWHEGDKEIPLKKRRGSFPGRMRGETIIMLEKEKKMKPKMKSKTNKKCSALPNSDEQDKEKESKEIYTSSTNSSVKKMNKRGSVIMEGSRCSRVNGRGWRCCQQTLVGYSLCEHHLGKGRLRSITSVRSRATGAPITTINTSTSTIAPQPHEHDIKFERLSSVVQSAGQDAEEILLDDSYDDEDDEDDDNDDDYDDDEKKKKKPVLVRKKRMKPGMVKARSLSSLLNQTNNVVAVAAGNWNSSN